MALSSGGRVDQPSTIPTAPNRSERLEPGRNVTTQSPQRPGMVSNRLAAPVLHGPNAPARAGAALRVVDGTKATCSPCAPWQPAWASPRPPSTSSSARETYRMFGSPTQSASPRLIWTPTLVAAEVNPVMPESRNLWRTP